MKTISGVLWSLLCLIAISLPPICLYILSTKDVEEKLPISQNLKIDFDDTLNLDFASYDQKVVTLKMDENMKKEQSGSLLLALSQIELLNTFSNNTVVLSNIDSNIFYQFELTSEYIELTNLDVGDYPIYIKGQYPDNYKINSRQIHISNQHFLLISNLCQLLLER
ncbi:hypothetical protein [Enterococcus larvae]|uniref:hypothetical protein n=1 Tax=Enterococcus larvae TaxID=2794352 RepID=UPI003F3D6CD2